MRRRKLNTKGIIALTIVIVTCFVITFAIIDKIRFEIDENSSEKVYQLKINDQTITPNKIISKKNYIFDHYNNDYTQIKVPRNSTINLNDNYTLTNEEGKRIKKEVTYLPDGKYKLKTAVGDYKYEYFLEVDNDFHVNIDTTYARQGGYLVASFVDLNEGETVSIDASFKTSEEFLFDKDNTIIPIDYFNDAGDYDINFKSSISTDKQNISIDAVSADTYSIYWDSFEKKSEKDSDEYKKYEKAISTISTKKQYKGFYIPAAGQHITTYGDRFLINGDKENVITNLGIDISNSINTPVNATANGEVLYVGEMEVYGKVVVIDHGQGITSVYSHLNETTVEVGDKVTNETVIGKMGETGNVRGVHLNFEILINGVKVDPVLFLYTDLLF